ncbi:unnamed protein product [Cunninghamella blakesleeana]
MNYYYLVILFQFITLCYAGQTVETAAQFARQLVKDAGIGTIMTLFDKNISNDLEGYPFGLMEYYAETCESDNGDLLLFMSDLQMNSRNAKKNHDQVSFTIRSLKEYNPPMGDHSTPVQQPRFNLFGKLNLLPDSKRKQNIKCFAKAHPEAKWWDGFHDFRFYTFQVKSIYYVGGFGGIYYIGWIPLDLYQQGGKKLDNELKNHFILQDIIH